MVCRPPSMLPLLLQSCTEKAPPSPAVVWAPPPAPGTLPCWPHSLRSAPRPPRIPRSTPLATARSPAFSCVSHWPTCRTGPEFCLSPSHAHNLLSLLKAPVFPWISGVVARDCDGPRKMGKFEHYVVLCVKWVATFPASLFQAEAESGSSTGLHVACVLRRFTRDVTHMHM